MDAEAAGRLRGEQAAAALRLARSLMLEHELRRARPARRAHRRQAVRAAALRLHLQAARAQPHEPAGRNKPLPGVHGYVGLGAQGKSSNAAPIDSAAINTGFGWSAAGIRATAADEADFFRGLFSGKLLPKPQVAAMENKKAG